MRALVAGLLLLLAPLGAAAAEARKYAVLSLIGDRLLIVDREMATGSRLDRNERSFVDLPDATLDNATALAIDDALKAAAGGGSGAVLLAVRDPRLFALQRDMVEANGETTALLARLRETLGQVQATHLVLATKYRHKSMLRFAQGHVGSGNLEGLGFYIDHTLVTTRGDTGERGVGFLAPFAYFRLSLIDLADWKVVREEQVLGSAARSAARSKSGHPWETMSATAKVNALRAVIRREVAQVVPKLVAD
jgi:hypothetical protein